MQYFTFFVVVVVLSFQNPGHVLYVQRISFQTSAFQVLSGHYKKGKSSYLYPPGFSA